jgi:hypothetical protein
VSVVAAGNRETDRGVTYTMASPLANRFLHIDPFEVNFDDWRNWALNAKLRTEVINFINFRPGLLNDFDGTKKAFPTPRTWEFVHRILDDGNTQEIERAMIGGAVGEGAGAEFAGFLKIYRNLPNPDAVLMNPKTAEIPTDPATLYALCGALSVRASEANFDRMIQYCSRMKPEFQVLAIRDSVKRTPELTQMQAFTQWAIPDVKTFTEDAKKAMIDADTRRRSVIAEREAFKVDFAKAYEQVRSVNELIKIWPAVIELLPAGTMDRINKKTGPRVFNPEAIDAAGLSVQLLKAKVAK